MILWPASWTPSSASALLVLLFAGHVLADFLVQSRHRVETKARGRGYGAHGLSVFLTHIVVLLPLLSLGTAIAVAAVALLHLGIDWAKSRLIAPRWGQVTAFVVDQTSHVAVLLIAWSVLVSIEGVPGVRWLSAEALSNYLGAMILASAFAFNATGGSVIVEGILGLLPDDDGPEGGRAPAGYEGAGRLIGLLERTLVLALILYGQWAAIGLLITAKSIARFEELKVRRFAEYYLIGTLSSLLVALVIGFVLEEVLFQILA